ncbi:MAG: hypothetical protein E7362_01270 [Clostridiales bacterium]|nr:hypothetical protein [Clostridiales bacterium]
MLNKNFGKLINDKLQYAPNPLATKGVFISNPSKSEYMARGFLPVIIDEKPIKEGSVFSPYYVKTDKAIIKKWKEIILPIIEEAEENLDTLTIN